jgi:ribonuclease R
LALAVSFGESDGKRKVKKEKKTKPRRKGLSAEEVLVLMEKEDRPLLVRDILLILDLQKEERRNVRELLKDLAEEGKIVKIRGNRYGLPKKMNLVVGRVKCHPDGYGFVIPETPGEGDVFVSPRNLREAMHGDRVVVRVESVRKKGKEGRIIRVLERKLEKVVGKFMRGKNYSYLVPEDERVLQKSTSLKGETKRARPNQMCGEITRHQRNGRDRGRVIHLGYPDDPEVEPQIIIHKYDLLRFSTAASKEAKEFSPNLSTGIRQSST